MKATKLVGPMAETMPRCFHSLRERTLRMQQQPRAPPNRQPQEMDEFTRSGWRWSPTAKTQQGEERWRSIRQSSGRTTP